MDINNLKAFIAVADKSSFSRSAEVLHLTQPAVSKRIAALESELSTRLFDRVGRKVHLTEAGHILLPSARQISAELDRIEELMSNLGNEVTGTLRIATTHYTGVYQLPAILRLFRENFPKVELDLHFLTSASASAGVLDGRYEMALCAVADDNNLQHMHTRDVWEETLLVVLSADHPLLKDSTPSIDLLMQCQAIMPALASVTRELIDARLASLNSKPRDVLEAAHLETLKMLVAVGMGWGLLPEQMLDSTVSPVDIPELHLQRRVSLVTLPERTLSRAAEAFAAVLPQL